MKALFPLFALAFLTVLLPANAYTDRYRIVLFNQHNGQFNDRGSLTCSVEALKGDDVVWKLEKIDLTWRENQDCKNTIVVPEIETSFNRFRISIENWHSQGGGLAEIQVYKNDKNITKDCKLSVSAIYDPRFTADKLVDGITTSKKNYEGYWLLPDATKGYVDIVLP
jgi:hypothetical protein